MPANPRATCCPSRAPCAPHRRPRAHAIPSSAAALCTAPRPCAPRPTPATPRARDSFAGGRAPRRTLAVHPAPCPRFECLFFGRKPPVSGGKHIFKFASPFHLDFTGIRWIPPEIPFPGRSGKQSQTRNVIPGAYRTSQRLGVRSNCALKVLLTTTYGTLRTTGWSTQGELPLSPRGPTT